MTHGGGGPLPTPWTWTAQDWQGLTISISIDFDTTTHTILGGTTYRDAGCAATRIFFGLGDDGTPDTTTHVIDVPAGTTTLTPDDFTAAGLGSVDDVTALQTTAG